MIDKTKLTSARILVLFVTLGAILTGLGVYQKIVDLGANVLPIMSFNSYNLDTKFGRAEEFREEIENITKVITDITDQTNLLALNASIEDNNLFVHPTFFYEFVWCMLGFLLLYLTLKKFRKFSGQLFLSYGIWYGLGRTFIEGLRTDSLYIGDTGIRVSQLLSVCIVMVCSVILVAMLIKVKKHPVKMEGIDYFPADAQKSFKEIKEQKAESRNNVKITDKNDTEEEKENG